MSAIYDELGKGYATVRREDPAIAARIDASLGDAASVLNVGAGAGSYEPAGREVVAVEPSAEMISQRPPGAAPAIQASAETLPFEDDRFDAAMAVLTIHHWYDLDAGLDEMRRVARRRIVLVTFDPEPLRSLWFVRDYFPAIVGLHAERLGSEAIGAKLPDASARPLPVPRDCRDLFFAALWARPELALVPEVVRPMWVIQRLPEALRREGLARLAADLESGAWDSRNGHLRRLEELDVGLRLVVSELPR
ncbi:MAG: class I SAM-dependent methyltransferase [Solirubrobacterales bacterium]